MRTLLNIPRSYSVMLVLTACFLSSSGCRSGKEKVVAVRGTVTHNGNPVEGMIVSFVPQTQTDTGVSTGETDEKGKYELTVFKTGQSGAVVGTHKVWVSIPREPPEPVDKEVKRKKGIPAAEMPAETAKILKKYGKLEKTPLTVEVSGGQPIDLKLD